MKIDPPARPQTVQAEQREPAKSSAKNNPVSSTQQVFSPSHLPGVTPPHRYARSATGPAQSR